MPDLSVTRVLLERTYLAATPEAVGRVMAILDEAIEPSACARCASVRDCRDVLGDGSQICALCASQAEKEAFFRRLLRAEALAGAADNTSG